MDLWHHIIDFYSGYYLGVRLPILRSRQFDICLHFYHLELPARIVHFYHVLRDQQKSPKRFTSTIYH
jgi:hypothetical protein